MVRRRRVSFGHVVLLYAPLPRIVEWADRRFVVASTCNLLVVDVVLSWYSSRKRSVERSRPRLRQTTDAGVRDGAVQPMRRIMTEEVPGVKAWPARSTSLRKSSSLDKAAFAASTSARSSAVEIHPTAP